MYPLIYLKIVDRVSVFIYNLKITLEDQNSQRKRINRPHTPPIRISSSLPDKDIALLDKLNAGKTHYIVAGRLADEATCKRLGF